MSADSFRPGSKARPNVTGRARHVEDALCPAWTGPHELTNDAAANTFCKHCGDWWRVLDDSLNGGLVTRRGVA